MLPTSAPDKRFHKRYHEVRGVRGKEMGPHQFRGMVALATGAQFPSSIKKLSLSLSEFYGQEREQFVPSPWLIDNGGLNRPLAFLDAL